MKKRKHFGGDVKLHVVLRLLKGEASAVELAKEINCHPTIIGTWKDRLLKYAPTLFETQRKENEKDKKIEDLERMIGKLTVQNEFLKKVYGSFHYQ
jgi:transposase-like protein